MHGLDKNVDLTFLIGREVIQICIGTYQVIFGFDKDVAVSVEQGFEFVSGTTSAGWVPGEPTLAAATVALLGASVNSVHAQENGTLELAFSTGARLVLRAENSKYESYQITRPGHTIVV
jgi:Family of unknown function (DUF6188)